jgi:hypothetical protein
MTFSDRQAEAARTKKLQQILPPAAPAGSPAGDTDTAPEARASASKPQKAAGKPSAETKKASGETEAKARSSAKKSSSKKAGKGK